MALSCSAVQQSAAFAAGGERLMQPDGVHLEKGGNELIADVAAGSDAAMSKWVSLSSGRAQAKVRAKMAADVAQRDASLRLIARCESRHEREFGGFADHCVSVRRVSTSPVARRALGAEPFAHFCARLEAAMHAARRASELHAHPLACGATEGQVGRAHV